jgi:hypothetical protein
MFRSMNQSRRSALFACFAAVAAFFLRARAVSAQATATLSANFFANSQESQAPGSPRHERLDNPDPAFPPGGTKKALLEQRQKDIKKDIEKLFDLATQLKTEVEKTDATTTLSLAMVKRAEEIEKLARQIKDNARG